MLKSKRNVKILTDKESRRLTISDELKSINAYDDDEVAVSVEDNKIIIEKKI